MMGAALLSGLASLSPPVLATPSAATWRRQTLLGENTDHYLRWVTVSDHPGTYYGYSRSLTIEKVRKVDFQVVERFLIREVTYTQDVDSERWSEQSDSSGVFNLPSYLGANHVRLAFADDLFRHRRFEIDTAGVSEVFDDGRILLASRSELMRQIPDLGDEPCVVGIEDTGNWGQGAGEFVYLRLWSNTSAWDSDWREDLLMVPREWVR